MLSFHVHTTGFPAKSSRPLDFQSSLMSTANSLERFFDFITLVAWLFILSVASEATEIIVHNQQELKAALSDLKASSTIKIAPGVYKVVIR